ncbi:MAG: hypothetical protein HC866_02075 [Leptolyngbyaceae cyanobacterium RU_5_1]|nr:hypothetical protein [Leptolyngbyaceae cyanobacterium RU_5_1]
MANPIDRILSRFPTHVGLLAVIGITVITAGILVCVLPPEKQNSDFAKGFLTLVTGIVTGCFALLQAHQQSSSPESRQRLDDMQQQIEQFRKPEPISTNQPALAADDSADSPALEERVNTIKRNSSKS